MIELSENNKNVLRDLVQQKRQIEQTINTVCMTLINEKGNEGAKYIFNENAISLDEEAPTIEDEEIPNTEDNI